MSGLTGAPVVLPGGFLATIVGEEVLGESILYQIQDHHGSVKIRREDFELLTPDEVVRMGKTIEHTAEPSLLCIGFRRNPHHPFRVRPFSVGVEGTRVGMCPLCERYVIFS